MKSTNSAKKRCFSFTQRRIEKLPHPVTGRVEYRDTNTHGLVLRVTPKLKAFYFFRRLDGRLVRMKLGAWPETSVSAARKRAAVIQTKHHEGIDVVAERRAERQHRTLQDLFDHWIAHARLHKKTWKDDERQFRKYLGKYRNRRIDVIKRADVQTWHNAIGEKHGPIQANRVRALLSSMYGKAPDLDYEGPNPVAGVRKFRETSRERYLRPDEIRPLFAALKAEEPTWRDFFLLCLFTGARRGNVAAMRWEHLDLPGGTWHLPGSETKNGDPLVVVLVAPAVEILAARLPMTGKSPWVFPADSDSGHIQDPRKAWARVLKASGIENLRMHDLRRSLGSWQAAAGTSLAIIGKSLGHRDLKSTQIYSRLQIDPVRLSVENAVTAMMEAAKPSESPGGQEGGGDG